MSTMPAPPYRRNPFSQVLIIACALFILTIFMMVAAALNRDAAALAQFFDRHGMLVLAAEVGAIISLAFLVLAVERREVRRRLAEREAALLQTPIPGPRHESVDQSRD